MALTSLNHITIAVSDLDRSLDFYTHILGFKAHVKWDKGAYLSLGDLWFCLSVDKVCPKSDYSHFAFSIEAADFEVFCSDPKKAGVPEWKKNKSEGQSMYILDPDGHKLEVHVGSLHSRLQTLRHNPYEGQGWF